LSDTQSENELNNLKNLLAKKEEQIRKSMEEHHTLTKDLKSSKDFINELKNQKQDEVNQRKNLERDISSLIKNYESELITLREKAKSLEFNISQKISQETASKVKISSLESTVKKLESDKLLLNSNSEINKNIEIQSINEELIKIKNELSEEKRSKSQVEEELLNSLIAREEDLRRMDELNDLIKNPKNETSDNSFQSSKKNIDDEIKRLQKVHRNTKIDPRVFKILSEMMVEDRTSFEEQLSLINQNKLTELCGFKKVVSLKYDCKECRFGRQHGWRMYFTISSQQNYILLVGRKSNQERDVKRLSEFTALDF
jgi:chromosome segregation ATPase